MNGLEDDQQQRLLGTVSHAVLIPKSKLSWDDWPQIQSDLQQVEGIHKVVPLYEHQVLLQSPYGIQGVMLQGIDPERQKDSFLEDHLEVGNASLLEAQPYSLILGRHLAQELRVTVGDYIRVISSEGALYSPLGFMPSQRKFQIVGLFASGAMGDNSFALTHYQDAMKLARQPLEHIAQIRLYLEDPLSLDEPLQKLQQEFPQQFEIRSWKRAFGHQLSAVKMEKRMMSLMFSLIILVAIFNIVSALVMMVHDKMTDIAILKTQGMHQRDIMSIFMIQGMLSGVIGLSLGLVVGVLLTLNFESILQTLGLFILPPGFKIPIIFDVVQLAWISGATLLITFLTTLYPAARAAAIYPAEALRYE